jgi:hypothetical protein
MGEDCEKDKERKKKISESNKEIKLRDNSLERRL